MDLKLERTDYGIFGVFGILSDNLGNHLFYTLEHAYHSADGTWYAKIPIGKWVCKRGLHRLDGMKDDFETFEITDVPGRTGLLFHWGNYNCDSEGCILLGSNIESNGVEKMIINSKISFRKFMELQNEINEFNLTIS